MQPSVGGGSGPAPRKTGTKKVKKQLVATPAAAVYRKKAKKAASVVAKKLADNKSHKKMVHKATKRC